MKIYPLLMIALLSSAYNAKAQSTPADGHYLNWVQDNIKVYESIGGIPILDAYKYWNFKLYFYAEEDLPVKGTDGKDYIKIYIPKNDESKIKVAEGTPWDKKTVSYITLKDDAEFWLFLTKTDYDKLKKDHYPKRTYGLIMSAMTVPFKIHPSTAGHASSLYNSNWNAGSFIGCRLGFLNDYLGVSLGGFFGISSLNQTSAENTAITDNSSSTMSAVNYGTGLIIDVSHKFQIGTVVGWDHGYGDKSGTYIYQDKRWFAISLNFNFLDLGKKDSAQN